MARLTAAVKAAPTVGFIWGDGPTGYSIKYAWRSPSTDGRERIVLVTERRIGAHAPLVACDGRAGDRRRNSPSSKSGSMPTGTAKAKTRSSADVVVDTAARTLALDRYAAAPVLLRVTR